MGAGSEGLSVTAAGAVQVALPPAAGLLARHPRAAANLRAALRGIDLVARVVVVAALLGELAVVLTDVTIRYREMTAPRELRARSRPAPRTL